MSRSDDINRVPGSPPLEIVEDGRYRGHAVSWHARSAGGTFSVVGLVDEHGPAALQWQAGGFASLQQARDAGLLVGRAIVDALHVDSAVGVGVLDSGQRPTQRQQLAAELNRLEWHLTSELVPQYPDDADFWPAFAGAADVIEDKAGEHAAYVNQRIDEMLERAGKIPPAATE